MELARVNTGSQDVVVAPLGDIQWSGQRGPTAQDRVRRHIDKALELGAWFIGMGDYIDFLSPSNRQRLRAAALYDTAENVIATKACELVQEVYDEYLAPTKGRWLGMLEGHHFYEGPIGEEEDVEIPPGQPKRRPRAVATTDMLLAEMLECQFLGTSCYIRLEPSGYTIWAHHGTGGGVLPAAPFNKLYHASNGWRGADVYLMGHTTRAGSTPLSRPEPDWAGKSPDLIDYTIHLVSTGGFSKSSIVGHRHGPIPRGDYAEQRMLSPSPLRAPFIHFKGPREEHPDGIWVQS